MRVAVLEKENGEIDVALHVHNTFQPAYSANIGGYHPMRSLYQDQVEFKIWPKDTSLFDIDQRGSMPKTALKEATYTTTTTWNTKVGFTAEVSSSKEAKTGLHGEVGYEFSISAGANAKDFDIAKTAEGQFDKLGWISRMRNMYGAGGNNPIPPGYSPDNP